MPIYGQPNKWQCGPFALKHALLTLGRFADEDEIAWLAESCENEGTDEEQLGWAAAEWDVVLKVERRRSARTARQALDAWLDQGIPVLLCLDQWEHWVTAAGRRDDQYVIFDSHFDDHVLRVLPWDVLARRLGYRERRLGGLWRPVLYDLHPIVPTNPAAVRLRITHAEVARLQRRADPAFTRNWDRYLRALLPLAARAPVRSSVPEARLSAAIHWHGDPVRDNLTAEGYRRSAVTRELERLALVADIYGMLLGPVMPERVVTRLTQLVRRFVGEGRQNAQHRQSRQERLGGRELAHTA